MNTTAWDWPFGQSTLSVEVPTADLQAILLYPQAMGRADGAEIL